MIDDEDGVAVDGFVASMVGPRTLCYDGGTSLFYTTLSTAKREIHYRALYQNFNVIKIPCRAFRIIW